MIDITTLKSIRAELDDYVEEFADCIKTAPSRRHFRTVIDGQLSNLPRKNLERIALAAGTAPRTMQEFFSEHRWDESKVRTRLQHLVQRRHGDDHAIAVIDDTGLPKKGTKTPAVQRQYCGQTGKVDNCVVTVHLGFATKRFHTLLDAEPFLPEHTWHADRDRCRAAGIPDEVAHRTKWKIGLELLSRAQANGVHFRWCVADEAYGGTSEFREGLTARGLSWVLEVPSTMLGWTTPPRFVTPKRTARTGPSPTRARLSPSSKPPCRVDSLDDESGELYRVKETTTGPQVWDARVMRFTPQAGTDRAGPEGWLIVAVHAVNGQRKFFLSNAPADAAPEEMLEVAFGRWHIERCFRDAKQEVGMGHFEVRTWRSLNRHLIMSLVSLFFLAEQTARLRGEKGWQPTLERVASARGRRSAA